MLNKVIMLFYLESELYDSIVYSLGMSKINVVICISWIKEILKK